MSFPGLEDFVRLIREQHMSAIETSLGVGYQNIFASAFTSCVAIYLASLSSLSMLRAAKTFDVSDLPIRPFTESTNFRAYEQKNRVLLCAYGAAFVLLATFVYGFTTKTEMVLEWVCTILTLLLSCVALITVVDYALNKRIVVRQWNKDGTVARIATANTQARTYKRPLYSLLFISAVLAGTAIVYADSYSLWEIVISSLSFFVLRDGPQYHHGNAPATLGKAVKLDMLFLFGVAYLYWLLMLFSSLWTDDAPWSPMEEVLYYGIHKLSTFTQVVATFCTGNIIAHVYRHEVTRAIAGLSERGDHIELETSNSTPPNSNPPYANSADSHDDTAKTSASRLNPVGEVPLNVPIQSLSTSPHFSPLSTPIATFALFTYIFAYAVALLLAESQTTVGHGYIMAPPLSQGNAVIKSFMEVLFPTPPRIMAWALVSIVVLVACKWRWDRGGKEMWEDKEMWLMLPVPENASTV